MRCAQFYAIAIFFMGRLDTKGVGLKGWSSQRACSQGGPITSDPSLHWERKPAHDFLHFYRICCYSLTIFSMLVSLYENKETAAPLT